MKGPTENENVYERTLEKKTVLFLLVSQLAQAVCVEVCPSHVLLFTLDFDIFA